MQESTSKNIKNLFSFSFKRMTYNISCKHELSNERFLKKPAQTQCQWIGVKKYVWNIE